MLLTALYQTLLDDLNYFNVTILMAIESSVFPLPSEVVVPPAAYMAAEGRMLPVLVVFFCYAGLYYRSVGKLFLFHIMWGAP
jgi:membrane protein DedA with SNARE-associated domain